VFEEGAVTEGTNAGRFAPSLMSAVMVAKQAFAVVMKDREGRWRLDADETDKVEQRRGAVDRLKMLQ
jgi:hypothetical protein